MLTQSAPLIQTLHIQPMALPEQKPSAEPIPLRAHISDDQAEGCQISLPVVGRDGSAHALHLGLQAAADTAVACEWWAAGEASPELSLHHGWYHGLTRFREISRQVHFPHGSGMPGRAWALGSPLLMNNIAHNARFLRSSGAENEGLRQGLAWPLIIDQRLHGVLVLLAGGDTPILPLAEIWQRYPDGHLQRSAYLAGQHHATIAAGDSHQLQANAGDSIALAASTGQPQCGGISPDSSRYQAMHSDGVRQSCALPCLVGKEVRSVLHLAC